MRGSSQPNKAQQVLVCKPDEIRLREKELESKSRKEMYHIHHIEYESPERQLKLGNTLPDCGMYYYPWSFYSHLRNAPTEAQRADGQPEIGQRPEP